ncbi:superoxide dismutase[Cu-Zn] [Gordonia alkaliphila]|uniref:superoxide dismutase[Cu-Zn] n=1 Tax=Gordonia alkaliphila TaxID=1053547 RepID=UPI0031E86311
MGISRRSTVRRNAARGAGGLLVAVAAAAALTACGDSGADADELKVPLKNAAGEEIATAEFEFENGYVTVEVKTTQPGKLTPGFHGLHVHSVGLCQPNSTAPDGGEPGDFLSAGGHFQVPGHTGHPASGDLSSLQVRNDGSALLETTTSSFTRADLEAGTGTSIMIHSGSDNFANIPAERYKQNDGTPGPDAKTMATGDAGSRVACGVISAGAQQ